LFHSVVNFFCSGRAVGGEHNRRQRGEHRIANPAATAAARLDVKDVRGSESNGENDSRKM
jgi:hypothetical protein